MNIKCKLGFHTWNGCICSKCAIIRDEQHDWKKDCEKCSKCGKPRLEQHEWNGCKCSRCGKTRDEQHNWIKDCEKCAMCGKTIENQHEWDRCKCKKCGKTRDEQHDWLKDCEKCCKCGKTRNGGHDWENGKCSKCGKEQTEGIFIDERDGNKYKWIKISKQIWMVENLRYKSNSGCWAFNNEENNVLKLGRLYDYETAKIACPKGWHLPSDDEWKELEIALGLSKDEANSTDYRGEAIKIFNSLELPNGFNALLSGGRGKSGNFACIGSNTWFWTSTRYDEDNAWFRDLVYDCNGIGRYYDSCMAAYSVRCIKDIN